jgi:hypothetical protein
MVEEPAWRRDDDFRAAAQSADLRLEADSAIDGRRADGTSGAVRPDTFLDLERELASRCQDEAADRQTGGSVWPAATGRQMARGGPAGVEELQDREHEGGGLARTRLGTGQEVAAGEDDRDRLGLDRCRLDVTLGDHRPQKLGRQPELVERSRCFGRRRGLAGRRRALGRKAKLIGRHRTSSS